MSVDSSVVCSLANSWSWTGFDGFTKNSSQHPSALLYDQFRQRTLDNRRVSQITRRHSAGKSRPKTACLPNSTPDTSRDARFFADRGCFDIPSQHALDQLFQHYFWHVHPLFPIIDEVSFWEMHRSNSTLDLVLEGKLSLLVLYGILYTSSSVSYSIGLHNSNSLNNR